MQKPHYLLRIIAFIFSATVAYFMWTYLRPRFVTPIHTQPTEQEIQRLESDLAPITVESTQLSIPETASPTKTKIKKTAINNSQAHQASVTIQKQATPDNSKPNLDLKNSISTQVKTKAVQNEVTAAVAPTQKAVKVLPANRTITVTNGIEKKMLGYKKFGTHYPTAFKITINNTVVQQGDKVTAAVKNNTLVVRYDFEFMNGYRRGAREVTIELQPNTQAITLAFNWKQKDHLLAEETDRVISMIEKDVPYQA